MMDIENIAAPAFVVDVTADGLFRYARINAANERATGLTKEAVEGRRPSDIYPMHVAGALIERYRECTEKRALVEYESTAELPRGVTVWQTSLVPVMNASGTVTALLGLCKDVTASKLHHQRIETDNSYLTRALEALNGAHWQLDVQTGQIVASPSLALLMGEAEPRDVPWDEWERRIFREDRGSAGCDRLIAGTTAQEVVYFRFRGRNDETRWAQCRRSIIRKETDGAKICGVVVDVTQERLREMQLETEAYRDPLTNLLNRRGLRRTMSALLADPAQSNVLGVLVVDLDSFKTTNDRYGHAVGDDVLAEVARRLARALPATSICARMGGDEFTVVLQCTNTGELTQWQRVLSACLEEPLSRRGQMIPMGASIGRAFGPVHDRDLAPLLSHADEELYAVKRSRRARACLRPVKVA